MSSANTNDACALGRRRARTLRGRLRFAMIRRPIVLNAVIVKRFPRVVLAARFERFDSCSIPSAVLISGGCGNAYPIAEINLSGRSIKGSEIKVDASDSSDPGVFANCASTAVAISIEGASLCAGSIVRERRATNIRSCCRLERQTFALDPTVVSGGCSDLQSLPRRESSNGGRSPQPVQHLETANTHRSPPGTAFKLLTLRTKNKVFLMRPEISTGCSRSSAVHAHRKHRSIASMWSPDGAPIFRRWKSSTTSVFR
jgi:hypothetical protein